MVFESVQYDKQEERRMKRGEQR